MGITHSIRFACLFSHPRPTSLETCYELTSRERRFTPLTAEALLHTLHSTLLSELGHHYESVAEIST